MQIAILAGGLGTRLGALTREHPKSLVDVQGRPFLAWQLDLLRGHGVTDVVLCVGHLAEAIERHFGDGAAFGVRLRYSDEGGRRLGTAGALKWAEPLLGEAFFVLFGDSYLRFDYRAIMEHFLARDRLALMVVHRNENRWDRSDVRVDGEHVTAYALTPEPGMVHINAGLSVLRREALAALARGRPASLQELSATLIAERQLLAYETRDRFYEVGSPAGLEEFRQLVAEGGVPR
jgi:NDP-sugar pyrophosphorylase family protein